MKFSLWLVSVMALLSSGLEASAQEPVHRAPRVNFAFSQSAFTEVVKKVRRLESVSYRVGFGLAPGEFHKLTEDALRHASLDELKALLAEDNPILRVLGLICLARSVGSKEFLAIARPLYHDGAKVKITNGCVLDQSVTVGAIAKQLAEGRFFLKADLHPGFMQVFLY